MRSRIYYGIKQILALVASVLTADADGATAVVPLPTTLPFPPPGTYETDGFRFTPQ
jgi:hypothetical protein